MSQTPQTKRRRSQDDWNQLMTEYEAGELTQRQFCERHQLAYSTFCYWRKVTGHSRPLLCSQGEIGFHRIVGEPGFPHSRG